MQEVNQRRIIAGLLHQAGYPDEGFAIESCDAGGNNRVLTVRSGARRFAAKYYYTSPHDPRDRLMAEWRFLEYAAAIGIDCVPQPLARVESDAVALFEFVEGDKILPGAVRRGDIEKAADFLCALNDPGMRLRMADITRTLPAASEACFSMKEHFDLLDQRFERLEAIVPGGSTDDVLAALLEKLRRQWRELKQKIVEKAQGSGVSPDRKLTPGERCISPSDFGFHNVIARPNGELCFIDFEYAGWDDPAKLVEDFFYQPAVPVDRTHYDWFVERIMAVTPDPGAMKKRAELLRPIFGFKWCCIMLNAFIPEWAARRTFGNSEEELAKLKAEQLKKAVKAYRDLQPICAQFGV